MLPTRLRPCCNDEAQFALRFQVDVYSVGIVLVHLLHGSVVHVGEGGYELKGEQLQFGKKHGTLSLSLPDPEALKQTTQDLMSSMIRMDPAEVSCEARRGVL